MSARRPDSLRDLPQGATCVVRHVGCPRPLARRLMEMGLVPGTRVTLNRVAPLGDPVELRVRGYSLSIRRAEAADIVVADVQLPESGFATVPSLKPS